MTFAGWEARVLGGLGVAVTRERVRFLAAWSTCEGGSARNNPLNTTERVPGSTRYNSAGVQHFPDAISGTAATLLTLRLPAYSDLRHALAANGWPALEIAKASVGAIRTWGTDPSCVIRRLS